MNDEKKQTATEEEEKKSDSLQNRIKYLAELGHN